MWEILEEDGFFYCCSFIHFTNLPWCLQHAGHNARHQSKRIAHALALEQLPGYQGRYINTFVCAMDCACFQTRKFSCLDNQDVLCSPIMKYRIMRLPYYYKYNSRKVYFGTNFLCFRGSKIFWGGSQFCKETRGVRALQVQWDSLGSSPCFVLCDLRQVSSPLWSSFCIIKVGKCLPCWATLR